MRTRLKELVLTPAGGKVGAWLSLLLVVASIIATLVFGAHLLSVLGWTSTPGTFTVSSCDARLACTGTFQPNGGPASTGRILDLALQRGEQLRVVDEGNRNTLVAARTADSLWALGKLALSLLVLLLGGLLARAIARVPTVQPQIEVRMRTAAETASQARVEKVVLGVMSMVLAAGAFFGAYVLINVPLRSLAPKAGLLGESGEFTNRSCDTNSYRGTVSYSCEGSFRSAGDSSPPRAASLQSGDSLPAGATLPVVFDGAHTASYPNRGSAWGEGGALLMGLVVLLAGLGLTGYAFSTPLAHVRRAHPLAAAWFLRVGAAAVTVVGIGFLVVIVLALVRAT